MAELPRFLTYLAPKRNLLQALLLFLCLFAAVNGPAAVAAEELAGTPLNGKVPVVLGDDLGFGKKYRLSMANNFQSWGAMKVSHSDGYPVRLGEHSLRFETREGFCGSDSGWSDCKNGRSRHELSTAKYGFDSWRREQWYALSIYLPEDFRVPSNVGASLFQFLANGKPNWMFKFKSSSGLVLQREFDFYQITLIPIWEVKDKWHDFVVRIVHSSNSKGALTVWINGKQAFAHEGKTARNQSGKPYFKFGLYNTGFGPDGAPINGGGFLNGADLPTNALYYDEIRSAKSCQALKLGDLGYDCSQMAD